MIGWSSRYVPKTKGDIIGKIPEVKQNMVPITFVNLTYCSAKAKIAGHIAENPKPFSKIRTDLNQKS
jgi:hypothetical protein